MFGKEIGPLGFRFGGIFVLRFVLFAHGIFILLLVEGRVGTKGSAIKKVGFVKGTWGVFFPTEAILQPANQSVVDRVIPMYEKPQ